MITAYGTREVARWLGVTTAAVSNWHERYGGWPVEPVVQVISGNAVFYGWIPEQKDAWLRWMAGEAV